MAVCLHCAADQELPRNGETKHTQFMDLTVEYFFSKKRRSPLLWRLSAAICNRGNLDAVSLAVSTCSTMQVAEIS